MKTQLVKKILIVDDEENSRLYLAQILKALHSEYEVLLSATPTEALFLIANHDVDLVLLDVEMPGMTGLELLTEIRKKLNCVPAVFVSAFKVADYIQKAIRLGAVDYIDKPVDPLALEQVLLKCFAPPLLDLPSDPTNTDKLKLFTEKGDMIFCPSEIVYFESAKRYSVAYFKFGLRSVIVRENLVNLERLLPSVSFLRVGRQHIINTQYVKFVSRSNKSIVLDAGENHIIIEKVYPEVFSKISI